MHFVALAVLKHDLTLRKHICASFTAVNLAHNYLCDQVVGRNVPHVQRAGKQPMHADLAAELLDHEAPHARPKVGASIENHLAERLRSNRNDQRGPTIPVPRASAYCYERCASARIYANAYKLQYEPGAQCHTSANN